MEKKDLGKLEKLLKTSNITAKELEIILKQKHHDPSVRTYVHPARSKIVFGVISDTHIGHKSFDEGFFAYAGKAFKADGVTNVYHVGDILEGMSGRPGHIYELSHIGFNQQIQYAEDLFKEHFKSFNIYAITGNHDHWYVEKNNAGANPGEELQRRLPNFTFLGENEADIKFGPNVTMKLFHANDGTAYATSYKMQKLMESFTGGEKPNLLFEGHYHKAMYMFNRNIHGFEAGTLCGQSWFMRGKKLPAHKSFWSVELHLGRRGIEAIIPKLYPAYS